jgi:hypothetical protein
MNTGVSYFSSRDLDHVRADLRDMADHGCTYVVHCYTETDLTYYRETMRGIVDATHEDGLDAWFDPWGLAGIFSGETFTRFPLQHPDTWQVLSDGRRVGVACPNHPGTREFLRRWTDACAEAGGDILFWDEPHFYSPVWNRDFTPAWACYCTHCARDFRDRFGYDQPLEFTPDLKKWREDTLTDLLAELCRHAHSIGLRNALCLFPTDLAEHGFPQPSERLRQFVQSQLSKASGTAPERTPSAGGTLVEAAALAGMLHIGTGDFDRAAAIPDLDIFGTDPYWYALGVEAEPFMRTYSGLAADAARKHNRELQLWLQAFRVPAGREQELRMGVRIAEDLGATHLAAWSFQGTRSMSQIACADPGAVWNTIGEEFRRLQANTSLGGSRR